jgi:hypothetical protein
MPIDGKLDELPPAARVIEQALRTFGGDGERWIKGRERSKAGHCIIGAIKYVSRVKCNRGSGAAGFVVQAIRRTLNVNSAPAFVISTFNDSPQTTFEDVREVMLLAKCDAMRAARVRKLIRHGVDPELCERFGL